ncbi:MAG: DNA repair protein RecN [bacterium]|nr:DNA repair protein RecN [bacterium]
MLADLEISNFAIVAEASFSFGAGLNVLTGETGAGKSLVVEALNYLLGGSLREKPLRTGTENGFVSARFIDVGANVYKLLAEWGFSDLEEPMDLVLTREIRSSGRTVSRLNGRMIALSNLRELGALLVDFHGQHQQYALMRPAVHLGMVDHLSGREHEARVERYGVLYRRHGQIERELADIQEGERLRLREIDWSNHEIEEIDGAAPQIGEDVQLEERIKVLSAAEELAQGCAGALQSLDGEHGAEELLGSAAAVLQTLSGKDKRLQPLGQLLQDAEINVRECIHELYAYHEEIASDPRELDSLQERHEALRRLQRKYGPELADVLNYRAAAQRKVEELLGRGEQGEALQEEEGRLLAEMHELALQISDQRRRTAVEMSAMVERELAAVGLKQSRFQVDCQQLVEPGSDGEDKVEFLFAPNPGEAFKPLAKVASGGEMSRVMLALTVIFSRFNKVRTVVYDEIDSGLGGLAGQDVAHSLMELASRAQVICVTHLAVLAAAGERQYHMHKRVEEGRTVTVGSCLNPEERELELARMLSGEDTDTARRHACALLQRAEEQRAAFC